MAHELGIFSRISGAGTKNVCWLMGIITARMLLRADTFLLPMDVVAFAIIIATLHITYGETHFVEIMKVLPVPIFQDYINKIKILGNLYSSIYTLALDIKGNVTPP